MYSKSREFHGESGTDLYRVWNAMKRRVLPSWKHRVHYFDRGITICKSWDNSYVKFRDWAILNGYKKGLEIDRRNNNKGYKPSNCRFVTRKVNTCNRGVTIMVNYKSVNQSLSLLCANLGMNKTQCYGIARRVKKGVKIEESIKIQLASNAVYTPPIRVVNKKTGKKYNSVKEAALDIGLSRNYVGSMLKGNRPNYTGLTYLK
jgi:hypothetical protein